MDLQGDVRATHLIALTRARARVGYTNTGGGWLLTHAVPLDETVDWVEQNRRAVRRVLGPLAGSGPARFPVLVSPGERREARRTLSAAGALNGPLVGIHPSGGRRIKEWPLERWRAVGERLVRTFGATLVVTGAEADRALAADLVRPLGARAIDLSGRLRVEELLAVIAELDLFLSSDTGPMHLATAVDTRSVSVFGPSDPGRYFCGSPGPRHAVVRAELWCSPCNLIRRPPVECARLAAPECLSLVAVEAVFGAAAAALGAGGLAPRSVSGSSELG
jgi:ADP-heptose:LPS heptosyltransferase